MKIFVLALAVLAISASASSHGLDHRLQVLIETGYSVDNVVNLLVAISRTTGDHLQEIIDNWAVAESQLVENIGSIRDLLASQTQRCEELDATISTIIDDIYKYERSIRSAQRTIRTNLETIADRRDKRCQANLIFVQKLKDNKDGSRLLSYLRERLADPSFQDYLTSNQASLAEISHHIQDNKRNGLAVLAKHHMMSVLFQQSPPTTDDLGFDLKAREDVGEGQVDNDQGELSLEGYEVDTRNLDNFISEVVGYVDDLLAQLSHERHALQDAEFQSVEDLIDYQSSVDHQNMVLSTYIELWTVHLAELQVQLAQTQSDSESCHSRAADIAQNLQDAQADYDEKLTAYQTARASLEATLASLENVIRIYMAKVVNAPAVYLEKIDEELARARPVEPAPVEPLSAEEREEIVEEFEDDVREEEARAAQADAEELQEQREEAAEEREAEAIAEDIEERIEAREEEAREEAEPVIQEFSAQDLAEQESDLAEEVANAQSRLDEIVSGEAAYFTDNEGNQYFFGNGAESVADFDLESEPSAVEVEASEETEEETEETEEETVEEESETEEETIEETEEETVEETEEVYEEATEYESEESESEYESQETEEVSEESEETVEETVEESGEESNYVDDEYYYAEGI